MSTLNICVKYRPVRIGWCVREGNWEDLRKVLRLTHTLWGGRFNPLITLGDNAVDKRLIDDFQVDCLYPAYQDDQFKKLEEHYPHLPWPTNSDLFPGDSQEKKTPSFLDVYHPIRRLYEEYIKNIANPLVSASYFEWGAADPLRDILLATFGGYPPKADTGIDYKELMKKLNGTVTTIQGNQAITSEGWDLLTPSSLTGLDLKREGYTGRAPGIYYGSASDFKDVVNFWNLRAENADVFFYDSIHSDRLLPLISSYLIALRKQAPGQDRGYKIAAYIGEHRLLKEPPFYPADFNFGTDVGRFRYDFPLQPSLNNSGLMHFKEHSLVVSVDGSESKPSISFQFPEKPFFDDDIWRNSQHVILSIRPSLNITSTDEWTFLTPYLPELNQYYGREFHFGWNESRVELDGIGIVLSLSDSDITLRAMRVRDLISKIFDVYGMEAEPSRPGLIATRLIRQMGGLQKCRVFKIRGVRNLIETYSPVQSFTRGAAIQAIRDVDPVSQKVGFTVHESLYLKPREKERLKPEDAFTWLIEHGERWLRLIGQNVPFLKCSPAVVCLHGLSQCGQVVEVELIRRLVVKRRVWSLLVIECEVLL